MYESRPHELDHEALVEEHLHNKRRSRHDYDEQEQAWHEDHHTAHAMHSHHKHRHAHHFDYHDSDEESEGYIENPYEYEVEWASHHHHATDADEQLLDHHFDVDEDHWRELRTLKKKG